MTAKTKAELEAEVEDLKAQVADGAATPTEDIADMNIYQRINAISQEAGALAPVAKGGVPFAFRGIDGTINHLSRFLNKYGIIAVPNVVQQEVREREYQGNRVQKTTVLVVNYTFYGPKGDSVEVVVPGLADDLADRSTAQAMSVAYRIALLQLFHLPTDSPEPEETGQKVMDARGQAGSTNPAIAKAQAASTQANTTASNKASELIAEAQKLGMELGKTGADLNALGTELASGADNWATDINVLTKLVNSLRAEQQAKG